MTLTVKTVGPQIKDRQLSLWMLHYKLSCCVWFPAHPGTSASDYLTLMMSTKVIYKKEELLVLCLLFLFLSHPLFLPSLLHCSQ